MKETTNQGNVVRRERMVVGLDAERRRGVTTNWDHSVNCHAKPERSSALAVVVAGWCFSLPEKSTWNWPYPGNCLLFRHRGQRHYHVVTFSAAWPVSSAAAV